MTTYRAYRLDEKRRIQSGAWVEADSDDEARSLAAELCDDEAPAIELWQATRLVDQLDCEPETAEA